jgi:hypothetical protein
LPIVRLLKLIFRPITKDFEEIRRLNKVIMENEIYSKLAPKKKIDYMVQKKEIIDWDIESVVKSTKSYRGLQEVEGMLKDTELTGHIKQRHLNHLLDMVQKKMNRIEEKELLKELLDSLKNSRSYDDIIEIVKELA